MPGLCLVVYISGLLRVLQADDDYEGSLKLKIKLKVNFVKREIFTHLYIGEGTNRIQL